MATAPRQVISLKTEAIAWKTLDNILNGKLDPKKIEISFAEADWLKLHFNFKGKEFDGTALPSVMKGLIDFQTNFYRITALLLKDDARASRLTNEEKDEFEFIFKVSEGSSDFLATVTGLMEKLGDSVVGKMSGGQITGLLILTALLCFGGYSIDNYLTHSVEAKKSDNEVVMHQGDNHREEGLQALARQISTDNIEHMRILAEAMRKIPNAAVVNDESVAGFDSVIRQSGRADSVGIQGRSIAKEIVKEINKSQRRKPESFIFKRPFKIDAVDSSADRGFVVKLRDPKTDEVISASLADTVARERYGKVIQTAEWNKKSINVQIAGTKLGDDIRDARILSASVIRKKSN